MTDVVYEQLKAAIVELRIPPGERLREAAIAQGLNVSKTPVREALGRLEQDGLVELSSFKSAVVTAYTAQDLQGDLRAPRDHRGGGGAGGGRVHERQGPGRPRPHRHASACA